MKIPITAVYVALLILVLDVSAQAGDILIIPGARIGSVVLGSNRQSVHKALGYPQQKRRLADGLLQESWLDKLSRKEQDQEFRKGAYWKCYYLVVYFKDNRVVQAEVNSPRFTTRSGLSTASSAQVLRKHFRPFYSIYHRPFYSSYLLYYNPDPGGIPAVRHYLNYEDAVKSGIAWRYGAWGDLAPEPDPDGELEAIIIHLPKQAVVPDPDGGQRFVQTIQPWK